MTQFSPQLIGKAQEYFQRVHGKEMTLEEADQALGSLSHLFLVFSEDDNPELAQEVRK